MSSRIAIAALTLAACVSSEDAPTDEVSSTESAVTLSDFVLPAPAPAERASIVRAYDRLDPDDVIPRGLLEDAIVYFDANAAHIPKQTTIVVVDLSRYSGKNRLWLVDLATGAVEAHKVAHGDGSDPNNDGLATTFGNIDGSHKSSLGFYLTGEIYDGNHVHSMRLDGLSPPGSPNGMANTAARDRAIVMHEASYVDDDNTSQQGRSNGCLAIDPSIERRVVDRIHDGTLIYVATSPLAPPVGRASCGDATCDGDETIDSCPADCTDAPADGAPAFEGSEPDGGVTGGCSTSGGAGLGVAFGFVALGRRRRR